MATVKYVIGASNTYSIKKTAMASRLKSFRTLIVSDMKDMLKVKYLILFFRSRIANYSK